MIIFFNKGWDHFNHFFRELQTLNEKLYSSYSVYLRFNYKFFKSRIENGKFCKVLKLFYLLSEMDLYLVESIKID